MIRVRSGFSFREAAGNLDDVISRLVEIGATEALTRCFLELRRLGYV